KAARPSNWTEIVKEKCGLRQRSAYYYLSLAEGKSLEQHRAENRERVARHRALRNAKTGVRQRELDAKQAEIDKLNVQVDRLKDELASLKDAQALKAEIGKQCTFFEQIGRFLGEARELATHFDQNRDAVLGRMQSAKRAADSARKASSNNKA